MMCWFPGARRHRAIMASLHRQARLVHELGDLIVTSAENTQASVDALTAQSDKAFGEVTGSIADLRAEIDRLTTANPTIDLTGLSAAVQRLDDIVPDAEPTPDPEPAPVDPEA